MRNNQSFGRVHAYHACEKILAERILRNEATLNYSTNEYDWLGSGAYFWVDSKDRAIDWAYRCMDRGALKDPAILGAVIDLGHCLVLYEEDSHKELKVAFNSLNKMAEDIKLKLPENCDPVHGVNLMRYRDCATVNLVHRQCEELGYPPYDSVIGIFEEGEPIYPGADLRTQTHIQVALRNSDCVVAWFRPKEDY